MDEFLVDPVSACTPYARQEPTGDRQRRKPRRAHEEEAGQDEVLLVSEEPEDGSDPPANFYSPTDRNREPA